MMTISNTSLPPSGSSTEPKIGKRPFYRFFISWTDEHGHLKEFPAVSMIDTGSTSFAVSTKWAAIFKPPSIKRLRSQRVNDVAGKAVEGAGSAYTPRIKISFGNHQSSEQFEIMPLAEGTDCIVPDWYLEEHKPEGFFDGCMRFSRCPDSCFTPKSDDWSITYDRTLLSLPKEDVHTIGALTRPSAHLQDVLPERYHKYHILFETETSERLPSHKKYDHAINLQDGTQPKWGPIYKLSREELEELRKYLDKMLAEGKIRVSDSAAGAPILFVPKPNGRGLRLCVDYRDLNKITVKDRTPLPLMDTLQELTRSARWFTKIDLKAGYNLIRIRKGDEWKTAFRTQFGHYEYLVMPFGLTNAPATFQRMMNEILREFLGLGVVCYIDDILIYSETEEQHERLVAKVLQKLIDEGLAAEINKCEFHSQKVEFLGYIISGDGVEMSKERSQTIQDWKPPKSVKDVQVFMGFCNFYRRFIRNFSGICKPITDTLKGDPKKFKWGPEQNTAFARLKTLFHSDNTPIMRHFDPEKPAILETDSSDFAISGVLSQHYDGRLYPCAFMSKKLNSAELNYEIYDKEMLAIVRSFQEWRHYLQGSIHPTTVYTDHKNLEYFTTTKNLNRRQARWAEILSSYDFCIIYRKGSSNGKADALSRRPEYRPREGGTDASEPEPLLRKHQWIEVGGIEKVRFSENFLDEIKRLGTQDARYTEIKTRLENNETNQMDPHFTLENDSETVYWKHRLFVPDAGNLRKRVLENDHDSKIAGHYGQAKTMELVSRNFFWPGMEASIKEYVRNCDHCQRDKASRHKRYGLLHPIELPVSPWDCIQMDFITDLPESLGCSLIWVVIDKFTKMAHFTPIPNRKARTVAQYFVKEIWRLHGIPSEIISDRDSAFTSGFWMEVCEVLGIKRKMSTAFRPSTDGQTERTNQMIEAYLRTFCNYEQNDWAELLPLCEFAYNNSHATATEFSPFYANYGFHPRSNWPTEYSPKNPGSKLYTHWLTTVHDAVKSNLEETRKRMATYYDQHRQPSPAFKEGDYVMLNGKNIKTKRNCRKLDHKNYGPFQILKVNPNGLSVKLELPQRWRIHPTFHVSLLEPYHGDPSVAAPESAEVEPEEQEYTPEALISCGPDNDNPSQHVFLIKWEGFDHEQNTWEPFDHLWPHRRDLLQKFYSEHPHIKPDPRFRTGKRPAESEPRRSKRRKS
jgi:hypothetical protein